jgi:hypothetical protein
MTPEPVPEEGWTLSQLPPLGETAEAAAVKGTFAAMPPRVMDCGAGAVPPEEEKVI